MTNKSSIDRRTFLKGLGAATGLAATFMGSKVALGNTETAPTRVILVALQHGWGRDFDFDNKITGSEFDFQLPPHLRGFDSIKDDMVFIDGVRGTLWGNAHDVSYSDIFTAAVPWDETGSAQLGQHFPEPTGPSLDWLLGQHSGKPVLRVSARYRSWAVNHNHYALMVNLACWTPTLERTTPTTPSLTQFAQALKCPTRARTLCEITCLSTLVAIPIA